MIRLFGYLSVLAIAAGGFLFVDYRMAAKWSGGDDAKSLTFQDYLSGLPGRLAGLSTASAASGLPTKLADMLPRPPEGWTTRPVTAEDVTPFLPKAGRNAEKAGVAAVKEMVDTANGKDGSDVVTTAYTKGDRTVLIRMVRYPNGIFTSATALDQRAALQGWTARFRGTEFMTVRGLDVTEDLLPEGFRGRMFLAQVGGQIHLQVLTPKRMKDADIVPFFETLQVEAMNASVVDKTEGLGKVPVIVLVSALQDADRDAYLADVAARRAAETDRQAAVVAAAKADLAQTAPAATGSGILGALFGSADDKAAAPEVPAKTGPKISCETSKDGVKRCTVESAPSATE